MGDVEADSGKWLARRTRSGWGIAYLALSTALLIAALLLRNFNLVILTLSLFPAGLPLPLHRRQLASVLILTLGIGVLAVAAILRDLLSGALPSILGLSAFAILGLIGYVIERRRLRNAEAERQDG